MRPDGEKGCLPTCPSCGYDLTGTPQDTCPECGSSFDRELVWSGWYQRERPGWPRNWLLVVSIVTSAFGWGFDQPGASAKSWIHFGLVWLLAVVWAGLRWRALAGRRPWLALWFVPVSAWAPNRPSFNETEEVVALGVSLAFAGVAIGFALIRDWRTGLRGVLYGLSIFAWMGAALSVLGVVLSQTGIISASDGGSYHLITWEGPVGGINDLIALLFAATSAGVGWGAWRVGRRIVRADRP